MKEIILTLILIFLILYFIYINLYSNDNLIYEKATFDNDYYWVRNMTDKSQAANILAVIKSNMNKLIDYLQKNINQFPEHMSNIKDLIKRTRKIYIMETPKDEKFTSYTINKGEKIVFCLRSKILHHIHDINTIMYVVIHECAHVMCEEYGHTKRFKEIFKFLLVQANKIGIYNITDYRKTPVDYCGMEINEYLLDNVKID
jgi:predicted metal-dependent hydrolase